MRERERDRDRETERDRDREIIKGQRESQKEKNNLTLV